MISFGFDNSFVRDLPAACVACQPAPAPAARLLFLNQDLAAELGLELAELGASEAAALFAGVALPRDAQPVAQAYAGHQFGNFSPQLGDGRALLLGELIDRQGRRRDIAFKGSGRTPFSRGGDGKAALGPMLREVLIGEAMHALGIASTRALAVAATGETIHRDPPAPGAVLTRVAASHLRVGTFQYFAAQGDIDTLRRLCDYTLARHDPALAQADCPSLALLQAVAERQADLIAQWLNVGFIHGVMNTDNMALSGETIDYGPCAFMEAYDPAARFSSIDHGSRYAFARQPQIARWNLARFAEALLPLIAEADDEAAVQRAIDRVMVVLDAFPAWHDAALLRGQRAKLGLLAATPDDDAQDTVLVADWLALLQAQRVDFTLAWRYLAGAAGFASEAGSAGTAGTAGAADAADAANATDSRGAPLQALFADAAPLAAWLARWQARCARDDAGGGPGPLARAARMNQVNPWIIARNHQVEAALSAASRDGDMAPFERLLAALRQPFAALPAHAAYAEPAPAAVTACYKTYCGT